MPTSIVIANTLIYNRHPEHDMTATQVFVTVALVAVIGSAFIILTSEVLREIRDLKP